MKLKKRELVLFLILTSLLSLSNIASAASTCDYNTQSPPFDMLITDHDFTDTSFTKEEIIQFLESNAGKGIRDDIGIDNLAEAIHTASVEMGISPVVLLATLQKEKTFITKDSFSKSTLDYAAGCGCPKSGCQAKYAGLEKQMECMVETLKNHFDAGQSLNFPFSFGASRCWEVDSNVNIKNAATYSLFKYTPHTYDCKYNKKAGGNYLFYKLFVSYYKKMTGSYPECTTGSEAPVSRRRAPVDFDMPKFKGRITEFIDRSDASGSAKSLAQNSPLRPLTLVGPEDKAPWASLASSFNKMPFFARQSIRGFILLDDISWMAQIVIPGAGYPYPGLEGHAGPTAYITKDKVIVMQESSIGEDEKGTALLIYSLIEKAFEDKCGRLPGRADSLSIGQRTAGQIQDSAELPVKGDFYYVKANSIPRKSNYGTRELLSILSNASCWVSFVFDIKLNIGDISKKEGGHCCQPGINHESHQSGRDADLCLFYKKKDGSYDCQFKPLAKGNGKGSPYKEWDPSANYYFLEYIIHNIDVKEVLVDKALQASIKSWAEKEEGSFSKDIIPKIRGVSSDHEHHFHLAISCPQDDIPECKE